MFNAHKSLTNIMKIVKGKDKSSNKNSTIIIKFKNYIKNY